MSSMPFKKGNKLWDNPNAKKNWFRKGDRLDKRTGKLINCKVCEKEFYVQIFDLDNRKYCSSQCYWKDKKGKIPSYIIPLFNECLECRNKFRTFPGLMKKGKRFCSKKCFDIYQTGKPNGRAGIALTHLRGENASNWQGGKTQESQRIRGLIEYKLWRTEVYKRDNWICRKCNRRGGKLNADHIKPFALYPELRFDIDNGRTLCWDCHRKTNTFGGKTSKIISLKKGAVRTPNIAAQNT